MSDFNAGFTSEGAYSPDLLVAGDHPIRTKMITVASGQVQPRGALMGKVTADGKYILSLSAAADGSEDPELILVEDVDATGGDVVAEAYVAGDFNSNAMTFGTGHTAASVRDGLAARSIYLNDPIKA